MVFEGKIARPLHNVMLRGTMLARKDEFVIRYGPGEKGEVPVTLDDIYMKPVPQGDAFGIEKAAVVLKFPNQHTQEFFAEDVERSFVRVLGK